MRLSLILLSLACQTQPMRSQDAGPQQDIKVMAWNIWHGGREDGKDVGPKRVVDVIRDSGADIVAMQETYGSGELISKALGFHFHPRGTNVSVHSRYPIIEDISVNKEFQCVGAIIELPDQTKLAFYSIWLPYSAEIWEAGTRDVSKPNSMLAACEASRVSLQAIWRDIKSRLASDKYDDVPIVIAGDFNSMSHLDYGEIGWDQYDAVVDWPTSQILPASGFADSYRMCNPAIDRSKDSTWTPRFPKQEQDRIDYIYHRGARSRAINLKPINSRVIRDHDARFPSDHAALLTTLGLVAPSINERDQKSSLRVVSYNIKHGAGMDGSVDLPRTAQVLQQLNPDFVGLQEVDLAAKRSGNVNQANALADMLKMHPSFGSFMDYQGGRYGMAILSKHPIVNVESLRLPKGGEPRVALIVEVRLPNQQTMLVVNVHFDWVRNDDARYAQAQVLAKRLATEKKPFLLLGDFNDVPESRTLRLFESLAHRTEKPADNRMTFSSTKPAMEIDFIFCAPKSSWAIKHVEVIGETMASDHRPVFAEMLLETH
jgi:endonuclease/exonuclease/phosphatase family metal-dependent hydrolase